MTLPSKAAPGTGLATNWPDQPDIRSVPLNRYRHFWSWRDPMLFIAIALTATGFAMPAIAGAPGATTAVIGVIAAVVAWVLAPALRGLLVRTTRRGQLQRAWTPAPPTGAQAMGPQWLPDPTKQARYRLWDNGWTDYVAGPRPQGTSVTGLCLAICILALTPVPVLGSAVGNGIGSVSDAATARASLYQASLDVNQAFVDYQHAAVKAGQTGKLRPVYAALDEIDVELNELDLLITKSQAQDTAQAKEFTAAVRDVVSLERSTVRELQACDGSQSCINAIVNDYNDESTAALNRMIQLARQLDPNYDANDSSQPGTESA